MSNIKMLKRFPDVFNKDPDSHIGRLFQIINEEMEKVRNVFSVIEQYRDIDQAKGYTLDKIGKNVEQQRGATVDDVFRMLIKVKIKRNLSDGAIDTIIEILSFLLNIDVSEIDVKELWDKGNPAAIQVDIPADVVNSTGLTLMQFGELIDKVAAGGVRTFSLFQGTFDFSSFENASEFCYVPGEIRLSSQENASETSDIEGFPDEALILGFSDERQIIGGELGVFYDPANSTPLPLEER